MKFILLTIGIALLWADAEGRSLSPFSCRLKNEHALAAELNEHEEIKQWLVLLDLLGPSELDRDPPLPPLLDELNFKAQYWNPLAKVKNLVTDCEEALAFWQRLGEAVENYLDHYPPLNLKITQEQLEFLFYYELDKRAKVRIINGVPEISVSSELKESEIKPLWSVELEQKQETQLHIRSFLRPGVGPIGALTSYEFLRQLKNEFPYFLSLSDDIIPKKIRDRIGREFPFLKELLQKSNTLPTRTKLKHWLNWLYLGISLPLIFFIILNSYLKRRKTKPNYSNFQ